MRGIEKAGRAIHIQETQTERSGVDCEIMKAFTKLTNENKSRIIDFAVTSLFGQAASSSDRQTGTEANP